jgi:hypothetical protein
MKRSDFELREAAKSYDIDDDGNYVRHLAYVEINEQVKAGRPWSKCPNCGNVYPVETGNDTTCSIVCWNEYAAYVQGEVLGW